jgi:hypothetical protein
VSATKAVNNNATYYAQSKRDVTITFNKNGNISQTDSNGIAQTNNTVTRACTYYNAEISCNVTSPTIVANKTPNQKIVV